MQGVNVNNQLQGIYNTIMGLKKFLQIKWVI